MLSSPPSNHHSLHPTDQQTQQTKLPRTTNTGIIAAAHVRVLILPELLSTILSYLNDNAHTLAVCVRVNQFWAERLSYVFGKHTAPAWEPEERYFQESAIWQPRHRTRIDFSGMPGASGSWSSASTTIKRMACATRLPTPLNMMLSIMRRLRIPSSSDLSTSDYRALAMVPNIPKPHHYYCTYNPAYYPFLCGNAASQMSF